MNSSSPRPLRTSAIAFLSLSLLAAAPLTSSFGQTTVAPNNPDPTPAAPAAGTPAAGLHGGRPGARLALLTPEERMKLKAARQAALQDADVKAAEAQKATNPKVFHQTLRAAMLRHDPTIATILEKLRAAHGRGKGQGIGQGATGPVL